MVQIIREQKSQIKEILLRAAQLNIPPNNSNEDLKQRDDELVCLKEASARMEEQLQVYKYELDLTREAVIEARELGRHEAATSFSGQIVQLHTEVELLRQQLDETVKEKERLAIDSSTNSRGYELEKLLVEEKSQHDMTKNRIKSLERDVFEYKELSETRARASAELVDTLQGQVREARERENSLRIIIIDLQAKLREHLEQSSEIRQESITSDSGTQTTVDETAGHRQIREEYERIMVEYKKKTALKYKKKLKDQVDKFDKELREMVDVVKTECAALADEKLRLSRDLDDTLRPGSRNGLYPEMLSPEVTLEFFKAIVARFQSEEDCKSLVDLARVR